MQSHRIHRFPALLTLATIALTVVPVALAGCSERQETEPAPTETARPASPTETPAVAQEPIRVNVDNFVRALSDTYIGDWAEQSFGEFYHYPEPTPLDGQTVERMQRDTIYSMGVFDLTAPLTITVPDAGDRFLSLMTVSQDHYIPLITYEPGVYTLTEESIGSRYVYAIFRIFGNPNDPEDLEEVKALQSQIGWEQVDPGVLELPTYDQETLNGLHAAIKPLGPYIPDSTRALGKKEDVDQVRHLIATAIGWAGNAPEDAMYFNITPEQNDGETPYVLEVPAEVPVDGFWSVTVYNAEGFMWENEYNAYAYNNLTAEPNDDGSVTIHFGGDPEASNVLPIVPDWNYMVRLYRPREAILSGGWKFPEARPAN